MSLGLYRIGFSRIISFTSCYCFYYWFEWLMVLNAPAFTVLLNYMETVAFLGWGWGKGLTFLLRDDALAFVSLVELVIVMWIGYFLVNEVGDLDACVSGFRDSF